MRLGQAAIVTVLVATGSTLALAADPETSSGTTRHEYLKTDSNWQAKIDGLDYQIADAAQDGAAPADKGGLAGASNAQLARQSANPLGGKFWILLNQFDNYGMQGKTTSKMRHLNTWSFQPVVPITMTETIGENWIWVNRPTLPIVLNAEIPDPNPSNLSPGLVPGGGVDFGDTPPATNLPFKDATGLSDLVYFSLLGQSLPQDIWGGGDFVWGAGPTFKFPTATDDDLGSGKYSAGPSGVLSFIGEKFIIGALYQQWFDYASGGKGSGNDVNFSWLNLFYFVNFDNGWQVGGTPIITANWESDEDNRWTVPIGLGVYKTTRIGPLPVKLGVEGQWMPVSPKAYGQRYNVRFVFAPIIPSLF